jgi:hypothetical protein
LDLRFWIVLLLAGLIVGCDQPQSANNVAELPAFVPGEGVVRGTVKFLGTPPEMETIANQPCHDDAQPLTEETVVVGDNGGLKNVFVYVKNGPKTAGASAEQALLDQVNCRYVPHVIGVQIGQKLLIRSSDPTLHNVHYVPQRNEAANFGMVRAGDERAVAFRTAEFIRARCDVHPWMSAYIGVFDNPLFSATNDAGSYEIKGLPPGKYTLATWHERYGELTKEVEIGAETVTVEFEYKAP